MKSEKQEKKVRLDEINKKRQNVTAAAESTRGAERFVRLYGGGLLKISCKCVTSAVYAVLVQERDGGLLLSSCEFAVCASQTVLTPSHAVPGASRPTKCSLFPG